MNEEGGGGGKRDRDMVALLPSIAADCVKSCLRLSRDPDRVDAE